MKISFTIGDIIDSPAECLVNTVNCEGFMGKGIAYQFKLRFPENERVYKNKCNLKNVKIGEMFIFKENDKTIINFPTKTEWRKKSEYSYIELGMIDLVGYLNKARPKSIAIPPLGCGNGGLEWQKVRNMILNSLEEVKYELEVFIYEPSKNYSTKPKDLPKMSASHLLLMRLKTRLDRFNKIRLQKASFFVNLFSGEDYFSFEMHKYGPYSHSIDICSKAIKEYQSYHSVSTNEAEKILYNIIVSDSVLSKVEKFETSILKATSFVNSIKDDLTLEYIATILMIIKMNPDIDEVMIKNKIWSSPKEKPQRFETLNMETVLDCLKKIGLIKQSLVGYEINEQLIDMKKMPRYCE